jgi:hypothetical protein
MSKIQLNRYVPHAGTIKVAGSTPTSKAAFCALACFEKGHVPLDFLFIGANAGQQATKAAGLFNNLIYQKTGGKCVVVYYPQRVELALVSEESAPAVEKLVESTVWTAVIIEYEMMTTLCRTNVASTLLAGQTSSQA